MKIGYFLSCEEYAPHELINQARMAQESGFDSLWISDHFHPWNAAQGQSPFVWGMIGAISRECDLPITTAVTCPTTRLHPAIVAHAAATSAHELWASSGLGGELAQALPSWRHFEQASAIVPEDSTRNSIAYGSDVERHVNAFRPYAEAGFDVVHIAQIGATREATSGAGFFGFYGEQVLPRLRAVTAAS